MTWALKYPLWPKWPSEISILSKGTCNASPLTKGHTSFCLEFTRVKKCEQILESMPIPQVKSPFTVWSPHSHPDLRLPPKLLINPGFNAWFLADSAKDMDILNWDEELDGEAMLGLYEFGSQLNLLLELYGIFTLWPYLPCHMASETPFSPRVLTPSPFDYGDKGSLESFQFVLRRLIHSFWVSWPQTSWYDMVGFRHSSYQMSPRFAFQSKKNSGPNTYLQKNSDNKVAVKESGYILLTLDKVTLDTPFHFKGTNTDQISDMKIWSYVHQFLMCASNKYSLTLTSSE